MLHGKIRIYYGGHVNDFDFVIAGSMEPLPCPGGQYCQFAGLDTPTDNCSAGFYCVARSSSATPTDVITGDRCPAGYYCPSGSAWPTPCSPGTFSSSQGNTDVSDCVICDGGEYCAEYNLTQTTGNLFNFWLQVTKILMYELYNVLEDQKKKNTKTG